MLFSFIKMSQGEKSIKGLKHKFDENGHQCKDNATQLCRLEGHDLNLQVSVFYQCISPTAASRTSWRGRM